MAIYRKAILPFEKDQLRMKTWRAILPNGPDEQDPLWSARCKEYWELQQRVYGVKLTDFTMLMDAEGDGFSGFVSTYAVVVDVFPGERTSDVSRITAAHARLQ